MHRDLKPANLFLAENKAGEHKIKVLDFGVSKLVGEGSIGALTSRSTLVGSPRYMSPEQTQSSARTDARTDIWALGVVLYELVSGSTPFDATNPVGLAAAILTQDVPSLRARAPEAPASFEKIVMRCLEKKPQDRFPSIEALADALRALGSRTAPARSPLVPISFLGVVAVLAGASTVVAAWTLHRHAARDHASAASIAPSSENRSDEVAATATAAATATNAVVSASSTAPSSAPAPAVVESAASASSTPVKTPHHAPPHVSVAPRGSAPGATNPEDLPGLSDRK